MVRSEGFALFARPLDDRRRVAADAALAIGYVALSMALRHAATPPGVAAGAHDLAGPVADALIVATGLPLAVRRLWPAPVLVMVLVASAFAVGMGAVRDPFVAAAFAVYPVALAGPGRAAQASVAVAVVGVAVTVGGVPAGPSPYWWGSGPGLLIVGGILVVGAWMLGVAVRERRVFAARAADELAERAVMRERLRIARELHDVVAHSIGVIAVKAAVANHVVADRPEEAGAALRVIETASRGALAEMRQMLGILRAGASSAANPAGVEILAPAEPAPESLAPSPTLADLDRLAEQAEQAGLHVTTWVDGVKELPEALGLTVYRIVQEALTNAARYAAPAACRVTIRAAAGEVTVEVLDDGRARRGPVTPGYGLIGMRERVALFGGTLTVERPRGGGFRVAAHLPYGAVR